MFRKIKGILKLFSISFKKRERLPLSVIEHEKRKIAVLLHLARIVNLRSKR